MTSRLAWLVFHYKALSGERTPSFDTILKVVEALGIKLHAEAGTVAK